jgi:hypothetical protein
MEDTKPNLTVEDTKSDLIEKPAEDTKSEFDWNYYP